MESQNGTMSYSDKTIVNIIKNYLKRSTYAHAIMLDGEWGIGKTYFVKNTLIPEIAKDDKIERTPVYVSLYGVKNTEELGNNLFLAIIETRAEKLKTKGTGVGKFFSKIPISKIVEILGNIKNDGVQEKQNIIESVMSPWLDYDKHYFIFDDLERCPMPVNETLGFINQFVEQNKAKVLMIANENEIGTTDLPERELLKLLVASQSSVKWKKMKKPDENFFSKNNSPTQDARLDIDEVKWRADKLIDEKAFYKQVKEKLVGRVIVYKPLLEDVARSIFDKLAEGFLCMNSVSDCLKNAIIEKICFVMNKEKHLNIRTLQFILDFYVLIFESIDNATKNSNTETRKQIFLLVLESLLRVAIEYKKDGYDDYGSRNNKDFDRTLSRGDDNFSHAINPYNYFDSFKFVHDFVYLGNYDLQYIHTVVANYAESKNSKDTLTTLRVYGFEMENVEIYEHLAQLKNDLQNTGCADEYARVLCVLYNLKWAGIEIKIDEYTKIMKEKIEGGFVTIERDGWGVSCDLFSGNPFAEDCNVDHDTLKTVYRKYIVKKNTKDLNTIFAKGMDWGEDFERHIRERYANGKSEILEDLFLQNNLEQCINALKLGTVRDLTFFQRILGSLTDVSDKREHFGKYANEISRLKDFLDFNVDSVMKKFRLKLLKENLEGVLASLDDGGEVGN